MIVDGTIVIAAVAVNAGAGDATLNSVAIVYGSKGVTPDTVVPAMVRPEIVDALLIDAAFAAPAVKAVTATAAIKIFFIVIGVIPLEVL